jgi:hypothetical protein
MKNIRVLYLKMINIQVATPRLNVLHNILTLWKILNDLAQKISIMRLCAYNMHGTTSRSWFTFMFTAEGDLAVLQTALYCFYYYNTLFIVQMICN